MNIQLGLHLDGQRCAPARNVLGQVIVGPRGLLDILEGQLGLVRPSVSQSERIIAYRAGLEACNHPARFYHRTFEADAMGTAATLLAWRDEWRLHGWSGQVAQAPARLQDMAEVEQAVAGVLAPGIGERVAAVQAAMSLRKVALDGIVLLDPLAEFPKRWRELLACLPLAPLTPAPDVAGQTFLNRLQRMLVAVQAGAASAAPLQWSDDGSIKVVRGGTSLLAARWLAERMRQSDGRALLVSGADGPLLDAVLAGAGAPCQGARDISLLRPALQVLPLALESLWAPLDCHGLLQFLTHPICPVPTFARRTLAAALAEKPGIGGASWVDALNTIAIHYGDKAGAIAQTIATWVGQPQHARSDAAPVDVFVQRAKLMAAYFQSRMVHVDDPALDAFRAAQAQCQNLVDALCALVEQGVETIRHRQLQVLAEQASAGCDNPANVAELGSVLNITHPGAAITPADTVFWWQMSMPVLPAAYPWSASELAALAACGVDLPTIGTVLERDARHWLRPVLAARHCLVLVLPPEGVEVHPLWQMIDNLCEAMPVRDLDACLALGGDGIAQVPYIPLQAPRRWWRLPEHVALPTIAKASFSQLELMLFNPFQWMLRYPAALKSSRILAVPDEFRLFGNLAHALAENFFRLDDALVMDDARFSAWFATAFDKLIVEDGALLLMPGKRCAREKLRTDLHQALSSLRRQFVAAGIQAVHPEMAVAGTFVGGALEGSADLVVVDALGRRGIVDMKWSGDKKFPAKLAANGHLQLVLYGELLRQQDGAWPALAYFIISNGRLLASDAQYFADAYTVKAKVDENAAQVWQRFLETFRWRQAQIAGGRFELALESIEADADSVAPDSGLALEILNERYNDYLALAGWKE